MAWIYVDLIVLNAVAAAVFLGENITPMRWLGTLCGTVLVGLTVPRTETP